MKYIYGPVASRRLGISLGIDIIPYKTCSFDCVYCQLGRTTNKTVERSEYFPKEEVLRDVGATLAVVQIRGQGQALPLQGKRREIKRCATRGRDSSLALRMTEEGRMPEKVRKMDPPASGGGRIQRIDYVTFSGSGEPTLNSGIGELIREIKKITKIPVAVLTNGSLFYDAEVRADLLGADLVIPSLDAACDEIIEFVNRPHPSLNIEKIVSGLKKFRQEYKGKLWLEVMMVKGMNDSVKHVELLKSKIKEIEPDKVQLNTVVRPPSVRLRRIARPLSWAELEAIKNVIGGNCEVIGGFKRREGMGDSRTAPTIKGIGDNILALVKRRPVTLSEMSSSLGIQRNELIKYLDVLERGGRIKKLKHKGLTYYEHK